MTGRSDLADIPRAWQIAVAILWLGATTEDYALSLTPDELASHFESFLCDGGEMLSSQVSSIRAAIETALCHEDPAIARAILLGVNERMEVLEIDCAQWEDNAVIVPHQRFEPHLVQGENVLPFPGQRPEGGAA